MRVLLDTHTFFWAVRDPSRIPAVATELLTDPGNELLVSAVTPWEMGIKVRSGRFPEAAPFLAAMPRYLGALGASELPITIEHSLVAGQLEWPHRDPFDRMLAAQAILENSVLASADAAFSTLGGLRLAWQ